MEGPGDSPNLHGVFAKLGRAEKHLQILDREVRRYVESRPYVPFVQPTPQPEIAADPESIPAFLIIARRVEPLPDAIHLVAGDAIHNIRCALDYLAWQLVLQSGQTPGRKTEFPIWWERPKQRDSDGVPILMNPHPSGAAAGLLDSHWLQPYHAREPEGHPLFILNDLDRIDKHRHLNIVGRATGAGKTVLHLPDGRSITKSFALIRGGGGPDSPFPRGFQEGAVLGVYGQTEVGDAPYRYGEVHVDCEVSIEIALGEFGGFDDPAQSITGQIRQLLDFVRNKVVSTFLPLFPG